MVKLPKSLKTRRDVENCIAMVEAGTVKATDVLKLLYKIQNQNYINVAINELSDDRKTQTVNYCAEAAEGGAVLGGKVSTVIKSVEHNKGTDTSGNESYVSTTITTAKAITAGSGVLKIEKTPSVYDKYGYTADEFQDIINSLEG